MRIKWGIDDQYVRNVPPYTVDIPDEELVGLDALELEEYIEYYVREEFWNVISYWWERD